jgi:hypothetical protein
MADLKIRIFRCGRRVVAPPRESDLSLKEYITTTMPNYFGIDN